MRRIVVGLGLLALALLLLSIGRDAAPAKAIQVLVYTNVTVDPGCLLVPYGTPGGTLIHTSGGVNVGQGGSITPAYPLDDTWTGGLFMATPEDHANYFDRNWYQILYPATATFDLGAPFEGLYIALSQDHGPYPEEALEYTVEVSNDNVNYTTLSTDTPITMYRRGWSAAGETVPCVSGFTAEPGGQSTDGGSWPDTANDDWSALWHLPAPYQYARLTAIASTGLYSEPEIDAVMGVEFFTGTIGYWKNHPDVAVGLLPITLGDDDTNGVCVSVDDADDVVAIMKAAKAKDAADMLRAQLLAAKLNVAVGPVPPADYVAIMSDIADADELLGQNGCEPATGRRGADRAEAIALIEALDAFNNKYSS